MPSGRSGCSARLIVACLTQIPNPWPLVGKMIDPNNHFTGTSGMGQTSPIDANLPYTNGNLA